MLLKYRAYDHTTTPISTVPIQHQLMSRKDAWPTEQIDALFAVFDSVGPKELNEKMRPGARFGDFMEQACMGVFGQVEPRLMTRVRSRVARIKRDFLDYLILLREKERDPSVADEEYSKKLALLYQRLPKSLIGLQVTFDLKEDAVDSEEDVLKPTRSSTPPVTKPKPLFRVPVDKTKVRDNKIPAHDDRVPLDTLTTKYKLDGYGGGATVEKMSENGPTSTGSAPDKSIQIGEEDILSGPKNQVSAAEALRREEAEAAKVQREREERLRLRRESSEARSLFETEEHDQNSDTKTSEKSEKSETPVSKSESRSLLRKKRRLVVTEAKSKNLEMALSDEYEDPIFALAEKKTQLKETASETPASPPVGSRNVGVELEQTRSQSKDQPDSTSKTMDRQYRPPKVHRSDSDSDSDIGSRAELFSLPTSTPKAAKRHSFVQERPSPTKRNSSRLQRSSVRLDDEVDDDLMSRSDRRSRSVQVSDLEPGQGDLVELQHPVTGRVSVDADQMYQLTLPGGTSTTVPTEAPKRKRGRPRKDVYTMDDDALFPPSVGSSRTSATDSRPAKKKTQVSMSSANERRSSIMTSTPHPDTSMSSNYLPQYLESMQQFLRSVERLYILADGDTAMRRALAQLVQATTEKIERSVDDGKLP